MTLTSVMAVKAQRVGGVRRVSAKHAVARVGGLKAPVAVSMRTGGRQNLTVFAAGLDFAELEQAVDNDEEEEWTAPVVRRDRQPDGHRISGACREAPKPSNLKPPLNW